MSFAFLGLSRSVGCCVGLLSRRSPLVRAAVALALSSSLLLLGISSFAQVGLPPGVDRALLKQQKSRVAVPDDDDEPPKPKPPKPTAPEEVRPFGSSLFEGSFARAREDGLNANYEIMPGDHVAVYTWGAVNINEVFVVDGQGNIFLPEIGPIHLEGVKNKDLTHAVENGVRKVYTRFFNVYTNLITAKPVGVYVTGGVRRPGHYAGIPSDSVLAFLEQAGGIDPNLGSYRSIDILRDGQVVGQVDLYAFLLEGKLPPQQFQEGDTVLVRQRGPVVELAGNVATRALLEFRPGKVTGGDALAVVPGSARATQVTVNGIRNGVPFNHTLSLANFASFPLQAGDSITLRDDLRAATVLVKLEGEVQGPTLLSVRRGARLVDVLDHIPINPTLADTKAVHIRRSSVVQAQKDSIEDSLFRLERSALLALSSSNGESDIRVKEAELTRKFVERAHLIQPLGRVVTSLDGVQQNLVLEDGDTIVIPSRTNVVRVSGEVLMAQAVMYTPDMVAEDYVEASGGYTDRADQDRVIILKPNAEVVIGDLDAPIGPGDEILVAPRVDTKVLQNVADVTQIIYQVAVAAAVIIAL